MAAFPSKEEIEAANAALKPYFIALGIVAHAWNHLHEELGKIFCAVTELDLPIGMAIWHSLKSDRSQRDILKGAVCAAAGDPDWLKQHPNAMDGVLYLINKTNAVAEKRNDAIHAPCTVIPGGDDFEIMPVTFFGNEKAKHLRGKDILAEFSWYEKTADALKTHARAVRFALDSCGTWPEKPRMPTLGQEHPRD